MRFEMDGEWRDEVGMNGCFIPFAKHRNIPFKPV